MLKNENSLGPSSMFVKFCRIVTGYVAVRVELYFE
jgi:hypothetical protein